MADKSIIFSAPMVLALLADRKTQTRRLLEEQPTSGQYCTRVLRHPDGQPSFQAFEWRSKFGAYLSDASVRYAVGDRLWVRENVRADELATGQDGVRYLADAAWLPIENSREAADRWVVLNHYGSTAKQPCRGRKVPSIHMPRWASRLTLDVTDVRVERLNDISEADARAEGIRLITCLERGRDGFTGSGADFADTRVQAFRNLWTGLHGSEAWAANPWVVAVTFSLVRANVDHLQEAA